MGENTHACCCDHSEEALLKRIGELAAEYRGKEGSLIQVLHMAQGIYGYLPLEVQKVIADALDISLAEVSGVVTFYSFFSTQPRGEHTIRVCLGTACYVKGAAAVLDKVSSALGIQPDECTPEGKFSLTACRCIGACGLAPVMTINDDVYGRLVPEEVDGILAKYND